MLVLESGEAAREAGRLCDYPACCIEHCVTLIGQGRWPGWEMGSLYAGEREKEALEGQGTDIRWVPCPFHREHPPEAATYEPPENDLAKVWRVPALQEHLLRWPSVARAYGRVIQCVCGEEVTLKLGNLDPVECRQCGLSYDSCTGEMLPVCGGFEVSAVKGRGSRRSSRSASGCRPAH